MRGLPFSLTFMIRPLVRKGWITTLEVRSAYWLLAPSLPQYNEEKSLSVSLYFDGPVLPPKHLSTSDTIPHSENSSDIREKYPKGERGHLNASFHTSKSRVEVLKSRLVGRAIIWQLGSRASTFQKNPCRVSFFVSSNNYSKNRHSLNSQPRAQCCFRRNHATSSTLSFFRATACSKTLY